MNEKRSPMKIPKMHYAFIRVISILHRQQSDDLPALLKPTLPRMPKLVNASA